MKKKKRTPAETLKGLSKDPIHLFGCGKCELMIVEVPEKNSIHCPACNDYLDVFASYRNICFATELKILFPQSAVKVVKDGKGI